jgi:hypothetical protein
LAYSGKRVRKRLIAAAGGVAESDVDRLVEEDDIGVFSPARRVEVADEVTFFVIEQVRVPMNNGGLHSTKDANSNNRMVEMSSGPK